MMLNEFLLREKKSIIKRWMDLILQTYPADVSGILTREKNTFLNPVGSTFSDAIEAIFDGLCRDAAPDEVALALDSIVKIRSVQDFSPSEAVSFIFLLKRAIREQVIAKGDQAQVTTALLDLQSSIDGFALRSFDLYMGTREKIYQIKVKEVKSRTFKLLERANQMLGTPEDAACSTKSSTKKGNGK